MRKSKPPVHDIARSMGAEVTAHFGFEAILSAERAHAHSLDLLALMLLWQPGSPFIPAARA